MTICTMFFTFGFKISLKDYMTYKGYIKENMNPELIEKYIDEGEDILYNWFYGENDRSYVLSELFSVNNINFIVRRFTHDTDDVNNVVIGIDLGEIDRWTGSGTIKNYDCKEEIKILLKDMKLKEIISLSQGNCTSYSIVDYGVKDPNYENFSIIPSLFITQDDCDCCS